MATATATTEKRRTGRPRKGDAPDVGQTIRLPSAVRAGLLALAQHRGTSVSDIVRDHIPGMDWYATDAGQQALATLEHVIATSSAIRKSPADFAPETAHPDTWQTLPLWRYGTRYVHYVRQCEYETRNEAIQNYAQTLWGQLALIRDEQDRKAELDALCDDKQHAFVVGFVGLRSWHVFPSALELNAYQLDNPRPYGVAPTTPEQLRVFNHYAGTFAQWVAELDNAEPGRHVVRAGSQQLLTELDTLRNNDARPGEQLNTPDDDPGITELLNANGIRMVWSADGLRDEALFEFRWFPDESADDAVQRWARQMVGHYVEFDKAYTNKDNATPERFIRATQPFGYAVTVLRWLKPKRKMKT